jgi:hypothetical protein
MGDTRCYICGGRRDGACKRNIRVRRDAVEAAVLEPLRSDFLAPNRVARMAKEFQHLYLEAVRTKQARAAEAPRELIELAARIERLRARLKAGDPDMTADEIEAAIAKAESKRRELEEAQPTAKAGAKLLAMIPNAAELYRRQIAAGLNGDSRAVLMARVALRGLLGPIRLDAEEDGSVWANYEMRPAALIQAACTDGRGEGI